MNGLALQAHALVYRLDAELERFEDDRRPVTARYSKLRRVMMAAEKRLYRRNQPVREVMAAPVVKQAVAATSYRLPSWMGADPL